MFINNKSTVINDIKSKRGKFGYDTGMTLARREKNMYNFCRQLYTVPFLPADLQRMSRPIIPTVDTQEKNEFNGSQ